MRHKYETRSIVLSRTHIGEATTYVMLLTPDLGLVYGRAQSVRASGAKLAHALATLAESDVVLVRGKDGWRVTGAVLEKNWFSRVPVASRVRVSRVSELLLRLVAGEAHTAELFPTMQGFLTALSSLPSDTHEAAETLMTLRMLAALGLDTGEIPGEASLYAPSLLSVVSENHTAYATRIANGISISGL